MHVSICSERRARLCGIATHSSIRLHWLYSRHELEVFMPPRSKILPQSMQDGYRNSQAGDCGCVMHGRGSSLAHDIMKAYKICCIPS